jgi:hypothetical protein
VSELPQTAVLGMQRGEWPVRIFVRDVHAIHWMSENPSNREIWRVDIANVRKLRYVPPNEPSLVEDPGVES